MCVRKVVSKSVIVALRRMGWRVAVTKEGRHYSWMAGVGEDEEMSGWMNVGYSLDSPP